MADEKKVDRSRKTAKNSAVHVARVPLRVSPAEAKIVDTYFHVGTRLYNAVLQESLRRCRLLRADPGFDKAKSMEPGKERNEAFGKLADAYGFDRFALQGFANGLRKTYPGTTVLTHEVQELSDQAFEAVARWHYGKGGRPRFKSTRRCLHSMSGKDHNSAIQPVSDGDGCLVGIRWGKKTLLAASRPKTGSSRRAREQHSERVRIDGLIAAGHYRSARIVRNKIRGRLVYEAHLVFGTPAPLRHPVGTGQVGMDMGPSQVHWLGPSGAGHHDTLAPGVVFPRRALRRLSRALDRCHRRESPACFDGQGRHRKGRCGWNERSPEATNLRTQIAETHRVMAERRKTEHGKLINTILAAGTDLRCETQDYRSWQKSYSRSDRDMAPGKFITRAQSKAESAGGGLREISTRTTALSQVCICGRKKKPLSLRWHSCECGVEADRDLFSAHLACHVVADEVGIDRLDFVGARRAYGPRRQDLACKPGVETAGLAPGKPRVKRRPPPGERSLVRIAKRLGRAPRGSRSEGVVRQRPKVATEHEDLSCLPPQGRAA